MTTRVDELFAAWDRPDSPGAALAVLENGSVVYRRGYGCANLKYGIPITPSTVFHVASVSKQFTAWAIALLSSQGRLSLDDDIRRHLPEVPELGQTITIRHLVHHTSGLRDQWDLLVLSGWRMDDVITREHILKMVRHQQELNFEPGAQHLYCNTGHTLMAEIAGSYYSRERGTTYTVVVEDDRLVVKHRRRDDIPLRATLPDRFAGQKSGLGELRFARDESGVVTGFRVSTGRVKNLRFDRHG